MMKGRKTEGRLVPGWIIEFRAGEITLDALSDRIKDHEFGPKNPEGKSFLERIRDDDASSPEWGTYDDVNLGDLTGPERLYIGKKVWEARMAEREAVK